MEIKDSPSSIYVSVTVLSQMFLYLNSLQVDIDKFLQSIGIEPAALKAAERWLAHRRATWERHLDRLGEYLADDRPDRGTKP